MHFRLLLIATIVLIFNSTTYGDNNGAETTTSLTYAEDDNGEIIQ